MKEKIKKFREYLDYIERHYDNVQRAWALINEKCKDGDFGFMTDECMWDMINYDVVNHDMSKLSPEEFTQYRQFFFPTSREDKDQGSFDQAWTHHKDCNEHHWQNWIVNCKNSICVDAYLVMTVIDWVAMGFEHEDTARDYYEKNKSRISLPAWAVELMYKIFDRIYTPVSEEISPETVDHFELIKPYPKMSRIGDHTSVGIIKGDNYDKWGYMDDGGDMWYPGFNWFVKWSEYWKPILKSRYEFCSNAGISQTPHTMK